MQPQNSLAFLGSTDDKDMIIIYFKLSVPHTFIIYYWRYCKCPVKFQVWGLRYISFDYTIMVKIFCRSTLANFNSHCNSRHIANLASSLGARVLLLLMVMERDADPQSQSLLHKCPNVSYGILIFTSLTESKFSVRSIITQRG